MTQTSGPNITDKGRFAVEVGSAGEGDLKPPELPLPLLPVEAAGPAGSLGDAAAAPGLEIETTTPLGTEGGLAKGMA